MKPGKRESVPWPGNKRKPRMLNTRQKRRGSERRRKLSMPDMRRKKSTFDNRKPIYMLYMRPTRPRSERQPSWLRLRRWSLWHAHYVRVAKREGTTRGTRRTQEIDLLCASCASSGSFPPRRVALRYKESEHEILCHCSARREPVEIGRHEMNPAEDPAHPALKSSLRKAVVMTHDAGQIIGSHNKRDIVGVIKRCQHNGGSR